MYSLHRAIIVSRLRFQQQLPEMAQRLVNFSFPSIFPAVMSQIAITRPTTRSISALGPSQFGPASTFFTDIVAMANIMPTIVLGPGSRIRPKGLELSPFADSSFAIKAATNVLFAHKMVSLLQSGVVSVLHGLDENVERHLLSRIICCILLKKGLFSRNLRPKTHKAA